MSVELKVRVPLEKEVPVAAVIKEPQPIKEEQEFPELTEVSAPKVIVENCYHKIKIVIIYTPSCRSKPL